MNEKESNNVFKLSLYQENILLYERLFNADNFNPLTRYSINLRQVLPDAIRKLQKSLSKFRYDTVFEVGKISNEENSQRKEYDLYKYIQNALNNFPKEIRNDLRYNPETITQVVFDRVNNEEKTIKGVECKIGFYINDNTIVERLFYVDGFNPISRWSYDLYYLMTEISYDIYERIKKDDISNMWDDYDLINRFGFSIDKIREFSPEERFYHIKRMKSN